MPVPMGLLGARIGDLYIREARCGVDGRMEVTACNVLDFDKGGGPHPSDRRYRLLPDGRVTEELLTKNQAFEIMRESLIKIADQLVNKDGMTGGRCVELAQETLERLKVGIA